MKNLEQPSLLCGSKTGDCLLKTIFQTSHLSNRCCQANSAFENTVKSPEVSTKFFKYFCSPAVKCI